MIERLQAFKAEVMMKVAGFVFKKHDNPILDKAAKSVAWLNRRRYGRDALDFLEEEDSIDHLEYRD